MVQELSGKFVKLDFGDDSAAFGTLAGAGNGFFKLQGADGSFTFYNISHVLSVEESNPTEAEEEGDESSPV